MRRYAPLKLLAAATLFMTIGCARDQLRYSSHRTSATATDILTRQVLDNLARAAENPAALPYFSVVGQGSVQITDGGTLGSNTTMAPHAFAQELLSLGASRNITEQWALGATTNPKKLLLMQELYGNVIAAQKTCDPAVRWLGIGSRRDVPRRVSLVGRYRGVNVWVDAEHAAGLSKLAIDIINIATTSDQDIGRLRVVGIDLVATPMRTATAGTSPPTPPRRFNELPPALPDSGHEPTIDALSLPRQPFYSLPPNGPVFTPGTR